MSDEVDAEPGHQNLISYSRAITGWGSKSALLEGDGALFYAGGSWIPVGCNGAFRLDGALPAYELVDRADRFFGGISRGYSIKVRDTGEDADLQEACERSGLVPFGEPVPQMACRAKVGDPSPPPGVDLRPVVDEQGVTDFVTVNTDAYSTYGMPDDVLADLFDLPGQVVADTNTCMVVAYVGDRPVATALTYLGNGTAGLQWVGTVADVRHMRLGRIVTEWATNTAFEQGAASCTLQASPMGAPLYRRLGYETLYHYREFVRWRAPQT
jgi:hypothetical protein